MGVHIAEMTPIDDRTRHYITCKLSDIIAEYVTDESKKERVKRLAEDELDRVRRIDMTHQEDARAAKKDIINAIHRGDKRLLEEMVAEGSAKCRTSDIHDDEREMICSEFVEDTTSTPSTIARELGMSERVVREMLFTCIDPVDIIRREHERDGVEVKKFVKKWRQRGHGRTVKR